MLPWQYRSSPFGCPFGAPSATSAPGSVFRRIPDERGQARRYLPSRFEWFASGHGESERHPRQAGEGRFDADEQADDPQGPTSMIFRSYRGHSICCIVSQFLGQTK
jgi:hypothetical protein